MSATPEQLQAIKARGRVLVSASAGAGKTTVMISRLADVLEDGAGLDDILAVTFTKKAAAQMKEKLRGELIKRLDCADEARRENLRVQLGKIATADICTIDSFCTRLIRTYFYALKIDASFDVLAGGAEANALRNRAVDELFDRLYAEKNEDFITVLDVMKKKRSDGAVRQSLLSSYDEIRKFADYKKILEDTEKLYCGDGFNAVKSELFAELKVKYEVLIQALDEFSASFAPAADGGGYLNMLAEMRETLTGLIATRTVFNPPAKLGNLTKPRVKEQNAVADAEFVSFVKNLKKRYAYVIKDLGDEQDARDRFLKSGRIATAYSRVLRAFIEVYDGVKRDEGKLDYADLEHFALQLLRGGEVDTDVLNGIREKYKYVFVDEYQDVNPVQDEIINAVAGGDIFLVGDLKQAIYGFRGSSSQFFAEKSRSIGADGKYLILPDNFRSGRAVISFVNKLFGGVMKPPVCNFDYGDGHAMRGGARYAEGFDGVAEICLFENDGDGKKKAEEVYTVSGAAEASNEFTAEGLAVLKLVKEALQSEYFDPDEGRLKRVQTGDICVLTRKRDNKNARGIVRALSSEYPVSCEAETDICKRPEIKKMLDILSYLDNAEQDIPLTAALLSPLGRLCEAELARIRIAYGRDMLFRECCRRYSEEKSDGVAARLKEFYSTVEKLRIVAGSVGASRLIDEIMCVRGFSRGYDTEQKLAALRRLQQEAYSSGGELYLGAFLAAIRAGGNKITCPSALTSDCIKVMTMHASKGLEFPVVIIADIAAGFGGDGKNDLPFSEKFGFAPRCYSQEDRVIYPTALRKLYKLRGEKEELSNEVNLFYVACTRAKYALYVLTSRADGGGILSRNFADCYADLFDISAFTPRILPVERQNGGNVNGVNRVLDVSRADEELYLLICGAAEYEYPYETGVGLPVKSSASQLLNVLGEQENTEKLFEEEPAEQTVGGTGIDAGIAYHRFLELCDFGVKDLEGVKRQIDSFVRAGLLTAEQSEILKAEELAAILGMPAFKGVGGEIYREREFICRLPSQDYLSLKDGGTKFEVGADDGNGVIVQGAIDLLSLRREGGKVVGANIIDYKYSVLSDDKIKAKYTPQLALYRSVVCKIFGLEESKVTADVINIKRLRQIGIFS